MTCTDTQLKQALAKMLPENYFYKDHILYDKTDLFESEVDYHKREVLDTELLHLCHLVEDAFDDGSVWDDYESLLMEAQCEDDPNNGWTAHATWQQRTIALAKVKGIEIL